MIRALTCLVFCLSAGLAMGQSYEYTVSDASTAEGGRYTQTISLSVAGDATVSGWSTSVCHDSAVSDVCGAESTSFTLGLNPLGPLFFLSVSIDDRATSIPGSTDGASQGVVIDQNGFFFVPDNSTNDVLTVTYVADGGTDGMSSTTSICSAVGNPVVEAVVVCCGGASVPLSDPALTAVDGTVTYGPAEPQWNFDAAALNVAYDGMTGAALSNGTQSVDLEISNTAANSINTDTAGFSMGITVDPTYVTIDAINLGSVVLALDQVAPPGNNCMAGGGSSGPDISMTNITATGASVQVQNTMFPAISAFPYCLRSIDYGSGTAAATIDITVDTSSLAGDLVGTTTSLAWGDAGDAVGNSVTVNCPGDNLVAMGGAANINLNDATIELNPLVDLAFVRGDCNDDGTVNIADAVWIISGYLAMPTIGSEGPCAEACDANSDSGVDVADVSYILSYRFSGGMAPAAPFPACGTVAGAPCDAYASCP